VRRGRVDDGRGERRAGGAGGTIELRSDTDLVLGAPAPARATIPTAPATGTVLTSLSGTTATADTIILSGPVTTTGGGNVEVTSTDGDIVISGTLTTEDLGPNRAGITLNAPLGTIYVTGALRTSGADGTPDGDGGGSIVLSARRIVITGTVDASGEDSAASSGGNAGSIQIGTTGQEPTEIFVTGTIVASGGSGTTGGGDASEVLLSASEHIFYYGRLIARNGAANGSAGSIEAGSAGIVDLEAGVLLDFQGTADLRGADATTTGNGAFGGQGGEFDFNVVRSGVAAIFGSIDVSGGVAKAATATATLRGGDGGRFLAGRPSSSVSSAVVLVGTPDLAACGGNGGSAGGDGGSVFLGVRQGTGTVTGRLDLAGGHGTGTDASGGAGGEFVAQDVGRSGGTGRPRLFQIAPSCTIRADGGQAKGTGNAGPGGNISVRATRDLTSFATLSVKGGDAAAGSGGPGGQITLEAGGYDAGDLTVGGVLTAAGGNSQTGAGGNGQGMGGITIVGHGAPTQLWTTASIDISGGSGGSSGGNGGDVLLSTADGDGEVHLAGTVAARGGRAPTAPGKGGHVIAETAGDPGAIFSSASIDVSGAAATGPGAVDGGSGGEVIFALDSSRFPLVLEPESRITADGGAASGAGTGGPGGLIQLTGNDPITIGGSALARGGASPAGTGGLGGRFSAETTSEPITVAIGALIDVSGGAGATGGDARNNGGAGAGTADEIAVSLDADGSNTAAPAGGTVRNLGTIRANAGAGGNANGGDVVFDGNDGAGGAPAPGNQSRSASGSGLAGDFVAQ
jgi:hypothetical protein